MMIHMLSKYPFYNQYQLLLDTIKEDMRRKDRKNFKFDFDQINEKLKVPFDMFHIDSTLKRKEDNLIIEVGITINGTYTRVSIREYKCSGKDIYCVTCISDITTSLSIVAKYSHIILQHLNTTYTWWRI